MMKWTKTELFEQCQLLRQYLTPFSRLVAKLPKSSATNLPVDMICHLTRRGMARQPNANRGTVSEMGGRLSGRSYHPATDACRTILRYGGCHRAGSINEVDPNIGGQNL